MEVLMLYRCIRSGRTMEFNDPEDIEQMKTNESYVPIEVSTHSQGEPHGLQQTNEKDAVEVSSKAPQVKRGRPKIKR